MHRHVSANDRFGSDESSNVVQYARVRTVIMVLSEYRDVGGGGWIEIDGYSCEYVFVCSSILEYTGILPFLPFSKERPRALRDEIRTMTDELW